MIEYETLIQNRMGRIEQKAKRSDPKVLAKAAFIVRAVTKALFRRSKKNAAPRGQAPHTRKGRLPGTIVYFVDKPREEALIGVGASLGGGIGQVGAAHEHGGRFRKRKYAARPFAGPGLGKAVPLIGPQWSGTIGE